MRPPILKVLLLASGLFLGACALMPGAAPTDVGVNRPDGEGYAGRGELVLRIGVSANSANPVAMVQNIGGSKSNQAVVELRYEGLDFLGRAVFERHDSDSLAGPALPPRTLALAAARSGEAMDAPDSAAFEAPDTRLVVLDLRQVRQIHIQGKIVEVLEATPSGVVFRLY